MAACRRCGRGGLSWQKDMKLRSLNNITDNYTRYIADWIVEKTNIKANHITIGSFVIFAIPSIILFSFGRYSFNLLAVGLYYLYLVADYTDGKVARARTEVSELGGWLDNTFDWINRLLLMAAVCIGNTNTIIAVVFLSIYIISNRLGDGINSKLFASLVWYSLFVGILINRLEWSIILLIIICSVRALTTFDLKRRQL